MSRVRSMSRKAKKKPKPILGGMKLPAQAIASLGCGLEEDEILELEEFRQEALKITPEQLDAMSASEMELFSVICQLVQRAMDNHNRGRTFLDMGDAFEELAGKEVANMSVPMNEAEKFLKDAAKSNRELEVYLWLVDEIERRQGRRRYLN